MRVLIVEDNELFRAVMRATISFRLPSVTVFEAETVADGLRQSRKLNPELVLVDVQLPDGSGLTLATQLVRELPRSTVAICTSYDSPEYRAAAVAGGVTHFLPKDRMTPDQVLELLRDTLSCEVS